MSVVRYIATGSNGRPTLFFDKLTSGALASTTATGSVGAYKLYLNCFCNIVSGGYGNLITPSTYSNGKIGGFNSSTDAMTTFTSGNQNYTTMSGQTFYGFGSGYWGITFWQVATASTTIYTRSATTSSSTQGTVSTSGSSNSYDGSFTATANPKTNYAFVEWQNGGVQYSTSATVTIATTVASDIALTAIFRSKLHTLTVTAGAGGTATSSPVSGSSVIEGSQVAITANAAYNYTFSSWSGLTGAGVKYTFPMPSANLSTTANFTVRPSFAIALTKENGAYGTIALTSSTAPSVGETAGAINATGYTNVSYTMTATVMDTTHNMFLGWYSGATLVSQDLAYTFTQTSATALTLVAKFAQRAAYTIELLVSDGGPDTSETSPAYIAGCSIALSKAPDFTSPDRWLSGVDNMVVTATPAIGWMVAGWSISNNDVGTGSWQDYTGTNPLIFSLLFNTKVLCAFTKIPVKASVVVDAPSVLVSAGTAEISYGLDTGDTFDMRYGENAIFTATPNSGYAFYGWYGSDGVLVSSDASYDHVMTASLTLTAKFSATVSLTVAHSDDADDTGTVKVNSGTAGSTASASVVLGGTCVIKAIQTSGSIFDSWYLTSDSGFTPLEGYLDEYTITVTGPTALTARFLGVTDLEDRYLAVVNYNNNTSAHDPMLGIISSSSGEEITQAEWEVFVGASAPTGGASEPGNRFFKFTGSKAAIVSAMANSSLGFMQWESSYLTPIVPTPETGEPQFTASSPVAIGTSPSVSIVTNRHYMLTAVWGDPIAVDVKVKFADGCDESNGGFSLTPITANRLSVQGGITDKYLQGSDVVLSAEVENGYVFSGWFYDRAATNLASLETTFTHSVLAPTEFYAKFTQDTDAIYKWEGDTVNKMASWRSKRFMASKPFNPSSARVYADAYPVTLSIYMASSPDAPSPTTPTVSLYARNQDGFRLPMARPEKYIEIEVSSQNDVTEAVVATSMEGLSQ